MLAVSIFSGNSSEDPQSVLFSFPRRSSLMSVFAALKLKLKSKRGVERWRETNKEREKRVDQFWRYQLPQTH